MIIVSQDRDVVINFNSITKLWIQNPLENDDGEFTIIAEDEWLEERLGFYKTEERAKEVLQETVKAMVEHKKLKEASDFFGFSTIPSNSYYEMPEE